MNLPDDTLSVVDNKRILSVKEIISPWELISEIPLDKQTADFINLARESVRNIVMLEDSRLLVITWPCSIHDPDQALEVAKNLKILQEKNPHLFIVMRTYFEKPRTTVGWKWLVNDPNLDGSFEIEKWLRIWRDLLLKINQMWVPCAVEFLDNLSPQYIADLVSWWAVWARTTESQEHRKLASWLSMPIWFKNGTDWWVQVAIDAVWASKESHHFLSTTKQWKLAIVETSWTDDAHVIHRWGTHWTNFDSESISNTLELLDKKWVETWVIIDFSHANSQKNPENQSLVSKSVADQIRKWNKRIAWVMIESNIKSWNQSFNPWVDDPKELKYWISITDGCVDLETNSKMLDQLDEATAIRSKKNS